MKISIITVTLNSKRLNSYIKFRFITNVQKYRAYNCYGGSVDGTIEILNDYNHENKKIIIKNGAGIYESMTLGIQEASGDIISILNSDDIYQNEKIISEVIDIISKNPNCPIFLGDVVYFKNTGFFDIYRYYKSKNFQRWQMKLGLMPHILHRLLIKMSTKNMACIMKILKLHLILKFF